MKKEAVKKDWILSVGYSREPKARSYHVTLYQANRWPMFKARLFHWIFCKTLFGSWHGWTWLGDKKWCPDQFTLKDFDYGGHSKWNRSRRMPLYAYADLNCLINTHSKKLMKNQVHLDLTEDQFIAMGGTISD